MDIPSGKLTVRPWQIGFGRFVSTKVILKVYVKLPEGKQIKHKS